MTLVSVREIIPSLVGFGLLSLGVRTDDVDIEEILPGAQLKQHGVITFSRKRIGKAEIIGWITCVR